MFYLRSFAAHSLRVQVAADAADAPFSPEGDGEGPEAEAPLEALVSRGSHDFMALPNLNGDLRGFHWDLMVT